MKKRLLQVLCVVMMLSCLSVFLWSPAAGAVDYESNITAQAESGDGDTVTPPAEEDPPTEERTGWYTDPETGWKYYYSKSGKMTTGWKKISGKYYYFYYKGEHRGAMAKNKIVGTSSSGYYYVDRTGVRITDAQIKQAVKIVRKATNSSQSRYQKLLSSFLYVSRNYYYTSSPANPSAKKMPVFANEMMSSGHGNCFRYAATNAYIGRVLGYDTRVAIGTVNRTTRHGWAEIKVDGTWYIFDGSFQRSRGGQYYMRTMKTYPHPLSCRVRYTMSVTKNHTIQWK